MTDEEYYEFIQPYEVSGVSLTRINTVHDTPSAYYNSESSNLDNFFTWT